MTRGAKGLLSAGIAAAHADLLGGKVSGFCARNGTLLLSVWIASTRLIA